MSSTRPTVPPSPEPPDKTALPRDILLFFVQFSVALNKARAYPAGHPVLTAAIDIVAQNLAVMLQRRHMLTIGISRGQLLVDGVGSDEEHPVVNDLAERLHRHQLAAIQFRPGLKGVEFADLLQSLAAETWRHGKPLGLESPDGLVERWPHVALEPIPLDQLELGDASSTLAERQAEMVWRGLVQAALLTAQESAGREEGADGETGPPAPPEGSIAGGTEVAQAINARRGDVVYNRQVLGWIMQVNDKLGDVAPGSTLDRAVSELFSSLDGDALKNMLELGASVEERNDLLKRGARHLPVRAVLDLVKAAASLAQGSLSHSLLRLLGKLAGHADNTRGPIVVGAEEVLRDSVRQLVGEWGEYDPSADSHRDLLALLSRPSAGGHGGISGKTETSSLQVLQMALELGVNIRDSRGTWLEVRREIGLSGMLDLIDRGTFGSLAVDSLWLALSDQEYLGERLQDENEPVTLVERVLAHVGLDGADALLEALEHVESASRRRWVLRQLEESGPGLGPRIAARLPGKPWFVQRNLLGLLATLPALPPSFHPDEYTSHDDGRVRREAYKLLFANPEWRPGAITKAAADSDMGIVRLALSAALEQLPQELGPRLLEHLSLRYKDQDIRLLAIRILGKRPTTGGRQWLVSRVASKRGWGPFRRLRLEPRSPEVTAAVAVLAQQFGQHADVAEVLRLAQGSRDPELRAAARGVAPRESA